MAQHATKKRTRQGKEETCCRKTIRRSKFTSRPLDTARLMAELGGAA